MIFGYYPDPYTYYAEAVAFSTLYVILFWMFYLGIGFICAYVVYADAKTTRRMPAIEWAIIAFLLPVLGLLIYYVVKQGKKGR